MRFDYYKMINEMVATLGDALGYVKTSGDPSMLDVCVQSLQAIIGALSKCADDIKDPAVIENLNSLIRILSDETPDIDEAAIMAEKLVSVCRTGLKYAVRVLFIAELGEKWDAMDSVYKAMKKRDDVIVDVVLQPIFRAVQLPDGSQRNDVIYNDYLSPMGIDHILYKDYDMDKIRPDITFFSQPYENCTIDMFWPDNMAKYTRLVYLTYGTAYSFHQDIQPASFGAYFKSRTEQLCWKIPCQSDQMLEHYKKNASHKGNNVIVTGLAKWDYPVNISRENTPCPKEWEDLIKDRKVFLWNTHFILGNPSNGSQILSPKGLEFLKIFQENKDIALIWRPHPMTVPVLKVYNPEMLGIYYNLVNIVESSDNMTMDTNTGYAPAFAWSDALISDISTIIPMYILTKKPLLLNLGSEKVIEGFKSYEKDKLLDFMSLPMAFSIEDIKSFINDIQNGVDKCSAGYKKIFNSFYKYADGHAGERIADTLIRQFAEEEMR